MPSPASRCAFPSHFVGAAGGKDFHICATGRSPLCTERIVGVALCDAGEADAMRKLIAFDDDTLDKLTQLGRDRMATLQELCDEAFADLLKKHGVPIDLKDALRKSASDQHRGKH
jgi:hypothetical protein